uniref:Global transcription regulator sge1 (Six gene expression protein 1) n=1 Tax=Ganoderma boninense TaxID=34458 RepID=A0A5K1JXM9_9APHY|nr:Global transcription regulator sge1 (Six gene expression protein 1) [Ganoderma boninense]
MQFALLATFTAVLSAVGAMGSAALYSPLTGETLAETFYFKYISTERTVSDPKYATSLQVSLYTDKDGFKLIGQPAFSDSDPTTSEATLRADPATFPKGAYQVGPSGTVFSDMFPVTLCSPDAC